MKILLAGVRGSAPCCGPDYTTYGGHTTCIAIVGAGGERLLLDIGTGAQLAVSHLAQGEGEILVVLTHRHLDHIQGLPGFAPLYGAESRITIAAVADDADELREPLTRLLSAPLWPLTMDTVPATVALRPLADARTQHGGLRLRGVPLPHPGGSIAWRVDEPATGASLLLATDVEWSATGEAARERFFALCREPRPLDLLLMDGHLTADQVEERAGWGHSSADECPQVARGAGAARLLVTHHAPERTDSMLAESDAALRRAWAGAALARQGMVLELPFPSTGVSLP
jgi:ribonuclease BN (tRNA processing enzyme)